MHGMIACASCNKQVRESDTYFEDQGQICQGCFDEMELVKSQRKAITATGSSALGMAGTAYLMPFIMPFGAIFGLVIACMALGAGAKTFAFWRQKTPTIVKAREGQTGALVLAGLGCLIALTYLVLQFIPRG